MYSIIIINLTMLLLSTVIMLLASMLSKKNIYNREKMTPFECGFEPFNSSRLPFSIKFFLIAIVFLIFDVEIALMFPMILSININNLFNWFTTTILFMLILIVGLYHEWNQGALEWTK